MQILKPSPGFPRMASFGILVPSKANSPVGAQCRPSLLSMGVAVKFSSVFGSMTKAEMPLCFFSRSVYA